MNDPDDGAPPPKADWTGPLSQAPVSATYFPGEILVERFRIVRFIGFGGMGEVYEAEDLELRGRVALKTIRADIASDPRAIDRFKREIQLARRVTHGNVCRVFDLFRHGDTTFLTMEFLAGETLRSRLRRTGRMTTAAALPLVRDMVAALTAAHRAGIVHRDFKSENVMLVPTQEAEAEVRAVVTDFGLARGPALGPDSTGTSSSTGQLIGTPQYMAPEQLAGGAITTATDIYALGIVIYEMVTGTLPFAGDTAFASAVKRLTERPVPPRTHVPGLDRRWEAVILRCLERDPGLRGAVVADVVRSLEGDVSGRRALAEERRRRRWLSLAGFPAVTLLAALAGYQLPFFFRGREAPVPKTWGSPTPPLARRAVAILGFKNLSGRGDAAWLSTALSEMLTTELAAGGKLRTIPGENVARMKVELSLPETDSLAKDTLGRVRQNLGTDLVILGSYLALGEKGGGQVRLDLRLQDAASGETLAAVTESGTEAKLLDLVSSAGTKLRRELGVGTLSAEEASGVRAALPSGPEAARLYSEGLARLRLFDALAARDSLEKAVGVDASSPLAHSALAEAWSVLGYDAKAKQEAKRAFDLSGSLDRQDRLAVEGRYREMAREWGQAVEIYRTLWNFFPDTLDHGLRLAGAQTSAGRGKEALATVEALRKLAPPASEDPRIDLEEARAAGSMGDLKRQQVAAAQAADKGFAQGSRLLVARARLSEALAFSYLGDRERAVAGREEARRIYAAAGDRGGVARALLETADALKYQGRLADAIKMSEEGLGIAREIGDQSSVARALNRIASVLGDQGRLAEARKMYEETRRIAGQIGDKNREWTALNNVGVVLRHQGQLPASRGKLEECLAHFREMGDKRGLIFGLFNHGLVLYDQGDLAGARRDFEESLAVARQIGEKSLSGVALFGLGDLFLVEGDLARGRRSHEEALAIRRELGTEGLAAESLVALAALSFEEGRPAEAEASAGQAAAEFREQKAAPNEALAHAVLAQALLAQGKLAEARDAIDRALRLSEKSEYRSIRLAAAVAAGRIRAAEGMPSEAVKTLKAALAEATRYGLLRLQLSARLALGEIESRSRNSIAGRAALASLAREARAKGFGLVARKAEASTR